MSLQVLQWVMSIISWRTCFQSSQVVLGFSRHQELCENIRRELLKPTINTHRFNLLCQCDRISYISQSVTHSLTHAHACTHMHAHMHALTCSINQSVNQLIKGDKTVHVYDCIKVLGFNMYSCKNSLNFKWDLCRSLFPTVLH